MSNRLATQTSPYLLQHADNPVDWYPWGDDAFDRAKAEDKPVMLSIGYSACHWCHVMEAESFANVQTAALLNERMISVKVDREERPDVDQIYQLVVQLMGRGGGWPLTVFLTPARRPFFAGTYFPPQERHGLPSFPMVIEAIHDAWSSRRDELESTAAELTEEIMRASRAPSERGEIPLDAAQRAADAMVGRFDETHGGFGSRPKFPNTMALEVLLRSGDAAHVARAEHAMRSMRRGGIWDHLGGGFHRYSTDERWLVPHFEKMLYDNALLMRLAAQLHRATGRDEHAQTARGIATWLEREMTDAEGTFYSAQDADSEGAEGRFFVWRVPQLHDVLGASEGEFAARVFGVSARGNFTEPGDTGPDEGGGASVLSAARDADEVATELEQSERGEVILERVRAALLTSRAERPRPFRDEKVLATWNGLMVGALAEAAMAMGDDALAARALRALRALRSRLWKDDARGGHLLRVYKDGIAHVGAFLDDHGDLAGAAIDVHEATGDAEALAFAQALVEAALRDHWDEEGGSLTYARRDAPDLITMSEDAIDNAVPSGASSMAHALLRLASHRSEARYEAIAERVLHVHAERALRHPLGYGHLVGAMDRWVRGPTEIVIVAEAPDPAGHALARVAGRAHVPNRVLMRVAPSDAEAIAARWGAMRFDAGKAAAFVCRNRTCSLPVREPEALRALLEEAP